MMLSYFAHVSHISVYNAFYHHVNFMSTIFKIWGNHWTLFMHIYFCLQWW